MTLKKQMDEEKKLNEMMIPKKNKRLYNKIMYSQKKQKQEVRIFSLGKKFHKIFYFYTIILFSGIKAQGKEREIRSRN